MPKSKKENIEEMTLDPIEEKVKEPAPVEEPVEPEAIEEGEDITEPDAPIEPEFEEPDEEGEQGEDVEFDEEAGDEETDEDAPEESAPPFLGLMLGAKNAPVSEDPDPQSRIEALLWHIINGTTTDAEPQSRNEAILTAIANSGTYTEEAQSRIEALLISILNHEESDITPISRNEAILKAIANTGEYDEEPQSRNEELLIKWLEAISIVIGTASGAVASFNTSLTEPLVKCECEFSASQASGTPTPANPISIDGVSAVQVTDCGKNLLDASITPNLNSSIKAWGDNDTRIVAFFNSLPEGVYFFSYKIRVDAINGTGTNQYGIILNNSQSGQISTRATESTINVGSIYNRSATITITSSNKGKFTNCWFYTGRAPKANAESCTFYDVQLELGETATTYEPYNGTTVIINLGGTYYGGSVDCVTGKITLTHEIITFTGSENWSYHSSGFFYTTTTIDNYKANNAVVASNGIKVRLVVGGTYAVIRIYVSDNTDYIDAQTDMQTIMTNGIQALYELATPIVVYAQNTAEIPTIVGDNQVYADTGDVAVEYKKRRND